MSFWTFCLYLIGALFLLEVGRVIFILILAALLSSGGTNYRQPPQYKYTRTEPKLFPDHKKGDLAKKLGDLS